MSPSSSEVPRQLSLSPEKHAEVRQWAMEKSLDKWHGRTAEMHIELAVKLERYVLGMNKTDDGEVKPGES